ncbi:MAG: hypothetical protein RI556_13020, partial [Hydrogenovibrio sp.]|uniref:hypothetical protein n=1 Tax=Hydrogenovibrio sp. TaxID=2065821 RepID=UPI00286FC795
GHVFDALGVAAQRQPQRQRNKKNFFSDQHLTLLGEPNRILFLFFYKELSAEPVPTLHFFEKKAKVLIDWPRASHIVP